MKFPKVDIRIVGLIDYETYSRFAEELTDYENRAEKRKSLIVELSSEGGDADMAFAFVGRMQMSPFDFTIIANGYVASAATLILSAGKKKLATQMTTIMVHEASKKIEGTVSQLEAEVRNLRQSEDKWNTALAKFCGGKKTAKEFEELHSRGDVYMTAEEAVEWGLIDEVL